MVSSVAVRPVDNECWRCFLTTTNGLLCFNVVVVKLLINSRHQSLLSICDLSGVVVLMIKNLLSC